MRRRPRAVVVGFLLSVVVMLAAGPASALIPETEVTVEARRRPRRPTSVRHSDTAPLRTA
jgi:hypothetical protein